MTYRKLDGEPARAYETGASLADRDPTTQQRGASSRPPSPGTVRDEQAMVKRRRQTPSVEPLPLTFKWIAKLPRNVQPLALFRQYPRIANMMAGMWQDPESFRPYLHDLLTDRRGHRKGFPQEIIKELLQLRVYYEDAFPAMLDVYKDVDKRG